MRVHITHEQCADTLQEVGVGVLVTPGHKGVLPRLALHWEYMPTPVEPMQESLC